MKLKSLASILYSSRGCITTAIIYDIEKGTDLENGCSIEYAIQKYGARSVKRIEAYGHQLLISI